MDRGKHCSKEKGGIIKQILDEGKTFAEISRLQGCSIKMISNAKTFVPKVESRGRKPVMLQLLIKRLCRQSKKKAI